MARNQEKHDAVRRSFVIDRINLKAAAELHGVPAPTAARWKVKAKEKDNPKVKSKAKKRTARKKRPGKNARKKPAK